MPLLTIFQKMKKILAHTHTYIYIYSYEYIAASVVLWLACWPLVFKITGSLPAEAIGFFGQKNPKHAFLRRGSKAVCTMSQIFGMVKNPIIYRGSRKL
jgi:hypothetical protein